MCTLHPHDARVTLRPYVDSGEHIRLGRIGIGARNVEQLFAWTRAHGVQRRCIAGAGLAVSATRHGYVLKLNISAANITCFVFIHELVSEACLLSAHQVYQLALQEAVGKNARNILTLLVCSL
jgi:hypothetical protein